MKPTILTLVCISISVLGLIAAEGPGLEASSVREELNQMQGKPAPTLVLENWVNGEKKTLADLKGKIVFLDFWATWCGPCINAIPHNNEISKKYADKGVVIIGVCIQRGAEKMSDTVKKHGMAYPTGADLSGETQKAYKANSFPDYYVIDRQGILRWADIRNNDIEKAIEALLKES